mgnify:CR=1 FL=1
MIISALKANIIEYGSLYMYRELVEFSPKSLYELSGVSLVSHKRLSYYFLMKLGSRLFSDLRKGLGQNVRASENTEGFEGVYPAVKIILFKI